MLNSHKRRKQQRHRRQRVIVEQTIYRIEIWYNMKQVQKQTEKI
jgi:hypothetical protein